MDKIKNAFAGLRQKARETAPMRWSRKELAQNNLLQGAHQETIAPLLRDCPVRVVAGGEVLARAGDPCPALSLVLSGRLRMDEPSATIPATIVRAGDTIGELSLLEKAVVASTITAVESTRLLVIDRNAAWALIRTSHEIARNWLSLLAERTRISGVIGGSTVLKTTHLAYTTHDERTGLHNRHWLDSMLPRHIARSSASNEPLGLLLVEIDGFDEYVMRYGQAAGDRAHQTVAQMIVDNVRPTDLAVCYGTALYAVVLPDSNSTSACLVGERVRKAVTKAERPIPDAGAPSLTVSIGVTQFQPSTNASVLLAAGENALQMARASGGNRVAIN
jgi:diguanylate cyclase (GGDEF)-like protein